MTIARRLLAALLALLIAAPVFALAQRSYSQPELDQMLAPVALYPDPLLAQVLMAATYPAEVGEAARWSRANPGLQGDDAVRAAPDAGWDPSVRSLLAFPQILARMAENPGWTQSLGDAFLLQEPQVMETVQQLRHRARAAGNLQSTEQIHVQEQGQTILVESASPQYVYVPYYDPRIIYGPWWWPAYQPVIWAPWPGYVRAYRPGVSGLFWWGAPAGLSVNFFFGNFDWHRRHVHVVHVNNYYYRPPFGASRAVGAAPQRWQPDPRRRAAFVERRAVQIQPQSQPRAERRTERREERQAPRVQAQPTAPVQLQTRPQPGARPQPQLRQAEQRQERREQRQERREQRQERREERGQKAG